MRRFLIIVIAILCCGADFRHPPTVVHVEGLEYHPEYRFFVDFKGMASEVKPCEFPKYWYGHVYAVPAHRVPPMIQEGNRGFFDGDIMRDSATLKSIQWIPKFDSHVHRDDPVVRYVERYRVQITNSEFHMEFFGREALDADGQPLGEWRLFVCRKWLGFRDSVSEGFTRMKHWTAGEYLLLYVALCITIVLANSFIVWRKQATTLSLKSAASAPAREPVVNDERQ